MNGNISIVRNCRRCIQRTTCCFRINCTINRSLTVATRIAPCNTKLSAVTYTDIPNILFAKIHSSCKSIREIFCFRLYRRVFPIHLQY